MEYINYIKAKAHIATAWKSDKPVLTTEDEEFLNRITSDDQPPPLPIRSYRDHGGDAQIALLDGAQYIPLPAETPDESNPDISEEPPTYFPGQETARDKDVKPDRKTWSWLRRDSRDAQTRRHQLGSDLHDLAQGVKPPDAKPNEDHEVSDDEAKKEEEDMTIVLETLNLAAVNNRVFSISDETQELLQKFNQVLKDLIKGVPTAYGDLESLLTNGDKQLQKTYGSLPPFLQKLIEKLPENMTKGFGPEFLAVAAERATKAGINMEHAGKAAGIASKMMKPPNLKDIITKPGAIVGMLKSIITFLRARFPAFMGMNVLWSLALFVLLFVFWYCYKRGKETRIDNEAALTEQEVQRLEAEYTAKHPGEIYPNPIIAAASGEPVDEVLSKEDEAEAMSAARAAYSHSHGGGGSGSASMSAKIPEYEPSKAAHTHRLHPSNWTQRWR